MMITNYKRYLYGFIMGMCLEYIIRVEFLIYPMVIFGVTFICMVLDLVNEYRTNTYYDSYYKARNGKLNNWEWLRKQYEDKDKEH